MKKINEVFSVNTGFFTQLQADNQSVYEKLFDDFNPVSLNIDFVALCGNRYIAPIVSIAQTMKELTEIIINRYMQAWLKVKAALFADYDIIKPVKISITTDKEFQSDRNSSNENTENSYIYPFNEGAESINEGRNTANTANTSASVEKLTQTVTREGNNTSKPAELIEAEIRTRKLTFLSLVLNDIKEFCTLQVYA